MINDIKEMVKTIREIQEKTSDLELQKKLHFPLKLIFTVSSATKAQIGFVKLHLRRSDSAKCHLLHARIFQHFVCFVAAFW